MLYEDFKKSYFELKKEFVCCPICKSISFEKITDKDRHQIGLITVICSNCGLVMTNPRPIDNWYDHFYKNLFWSLYIGNEISDLNELYKFDQCEHKGRLIGTRILKEIDAPCIDFLDIGCGLGGLIRYLKFMRPSWNIYGLEPSTKAANFVINNSSATIYQLSLKNLDEIKMNFDFISLIHVLEHTIDPVKTLKNISTKLKPRGILYVEVPDLYSTAWRNSSFFHIAHNYLFDYQTLRFALESAGLSLYKYESSPVENLWPWASVAFCHLSKKSVSNQVDISNFKVSKYTISYKKKLIKKKISDNDTILNYIFNKIKKVFKICIK